MKIICIIFAALLFLSQPFVCAAAGPQPEKSGDLALEIFQMSKSLDELTQFLKSQQHQNDEYQKLQAAISYLSFRSRSIELLQYDLRFRRERRDSLEKAIEMIKDEIDERDSNKTFQPSGLSGAPSDSMSLEKKLKLRQDMLEELNTEINKLENEIQIAKQELASFESYVQEKLAIIK